MEPKQTIDGAHLIIGMDPATGTVVVLKNRCGPAGGAVTDEQMSAIQSVLTGDYARTLAALSALVEKIEDNPALFFGVEDTCADEFQEAQELLAKATSTVSPSAPAVRGAPKAIPYYDLFRQMPPEVVRICSSAIGAARLETFRSDIERCELDAAVDAARLAYDRMTQTVTSPADDERTFEARQMLGDIRAHAAGME
ncbi:hypothetical protein GAY31_19605 [Azospirillum brasilense]|nr:hypothetical protein [Azospirillum brasilense]